MQLLHRPGVPSSKDRCLEDHVNGSYSTVKLHRPALAAGVLACVSLLFTMSAFGQGTGSKGGPNAGQAAEPAPQQGTMSPYQGESDGVSAGGGWMEFKSEDKMTGAHRIRFELQANNYFREDPEYKPRVELVCEDGKYKVSEFNPGVRIRPNRPGFWGQPQDEVEVRIDDVHNFHGWNWQGRVLSMDKGTVRGMIGAQVFNIALRAPRGREIAEFSPAGLNLDEVRHACDITPKKPSKD
jgi:hypothetical protein